MNRRDEGLDRALGRAIRVLRTERELERKELAEGAGVSYAYLSEIESGKKHPSARVLQQIAGVLGVRVHELMAQAEARLPVVDALSAPLSDVSASAPIASERDWFGTESREARLSARASVPRSTSEVVRELSQLVERMGAEDVERVLDLARRLVR